MWYEIDGCRHGPLPRTMKPDLWNDAKKAVEARGTALPKDRRLAAVVEDRETVAHVVRSVFEGEGMLPIFVGASVQPVVWRR